MLTIDPPPAARVDVHYPVPVLYGGLFKVFADEDARVIYQHVQLAVGPYRGIHGGSPVRLLGYIEVDVSCFAPQLPNLCFHFLPLFIQDVPEDDFCAFQG